MSGDHPTCHRNGWRANISLHHTPPAPRQHALLKPMYTEYLSTSCWTDVGCFSIYLMMYFQSESVCLSVDMSLMMSGSSNIAIWMWLKRTLLPGMPKEAC